MRRSITIRHPHHSAPADRSQHSRRDSGESGSVSPRETSDKPFVRAVRRRCDWKNRQTRSGVERRPPGRGAGANRPDRPAGGASPRQKEGRMALFPLTCFGYGEGAFAGGFVFS
jgi:ribosomal protein L2